MLAVSSSTISPKLYASAEQADQFFDLFPHRFDYIYATHPEPGTPPNWQTEKRHPLTDRLLHQGSYLYGVRFGAKTEYCLLDVDTGSPYHPNADPFAIQRILAVLESIGLTDYLACTSSYSGGLHLYLPFQSAQSSWEVGSAITTLLENAGFAVKPGCLEVFPNRKCYSVEGKPTLFNGHRLPLQIGSYLLNRNFEPVWSDRDSFVQQWQRARQRNEITPGKLRLILKQHQRKHYRVSGKAEKFINDLNAEIELGWTGPGQTNYLLGRITMRVYIFNHILEGGVPLEGQALVEKIVETARSLPGYGEWCQHQHEIEQRATEWGRCIENSRYFHYGDLKQTDRNFELETLIEPISLNWNQLQSQHTRDRIKQAIADLLNQNKLPIQATARFKLLTACGIGGGSLYRHKDLWHPDFLGSGSEVENLKDLKDSEALEDLEDLEQPIVEEKEELYTGNLQNQNPTHQFSSLTSLFPTSGGNTLTAKVFDAFRMIRFPVNGGNALSDLGSQIVALVSSDHEFDWSLEGIGFSILSALEDRQTADSDSISGIDLLFLSDSVFKPP